MLWQVSNSGLSLLGSVHVLDAPTLPLSAPAWSAFGAAMRVVFEHDFTQQPDVSFALLPPDESLNALVSGSLFSATKQRCRELSLDIGTVSRFQPWLAGLWLVSETAKHEGLDPENGVDKKLLAPSAGSRQED